MATKIITYPSKSVGDTWFATEANSLKDVINSNVSAFLDHTVSAEVHRAIDDSASGATDLWSGEKIQTELTAKAAVGHIHDDRYYTETEIDAMFATAGGGGATAFSDDAFEIQDDGDNTKVFVFEASAISTGTTRTVTMADQDVDLAPGGTFAAANGTNGVEVDGSGNISLTENLSENVQLGATGDSFTLLLGGNAVAVDSNVVTLIRSAGVTTTAGTIRLQGSATGHDIFLGGGGGVTQRLYILCDGFTGAPKGSLLKLANVGSGRVEYGLPEFASDQFAVLDDSDATKKVIIEPSAISTSTTRTIFMPDADVDLGDLNNIGDMAIFEAHKNGTQSISSAWQDVTGWNEGAGTNTSVFSFNETTGELTVNEDGNFLFSIDVDFQGTENDRTEGWVGLSIDTGGGHSLSTKYTFANYATRNSAIDEGGRGGVAVLNASSGDKFKIQSRSIGTDADILGESARFYAVWLKGPKGDTGATGPAGGNEKEDNVFRIIDNTDNTKKVAFDVGSVSTSTTRTITMPDEDVDLGALGGTTLGSWSSLTAGAKVSSGTAKGAVDSEERVLLSGQYSMTGIVRLDVVATLPVSLRPTTNYRYITGIYYQNSSFASFLAILRIDTSGNVIYYGPTTRTAGTFYFEHCSFQRNVP
jgi:hypothetical protein